MHTSSQLLILRLPVCSWNSATVGVSAHGHGQRLHLRTGCSLAHGRLLPGSGSCFSPSQSPVPLQSGQWAVGNFLKKVTAWGLTSSAREDAAAFHCHGRPSEGLVRRRRLLLAEPVSPSAVLECLLCSPVRRPPRAFRSVPGTQPRSSHVHYSKQNTKQNQIFMRMDKTEAECL